MALAVGLVGTGQAEVVVSVYPVNLGSHVNPVQLGPMCIRLS